MYDPKLNKTFLWILLSVHGFVGFNSLSSDLSVSTAPQCRQLLRTIRTWPPLHRATLF